jgi:PAS domain S-box-containing protein
VERLKQITKELDEMMQFISVHKDIVLERLNDFSIPMALLDEKKKFVKVNEAFGKLFGFDPREVTGKSIDIILGPNELQETSKLYSSSFKNQSEYSRIIMEAKRKNGSLFPILYSAKNIHIKDHKKYRMGIYADISNISETQERVQEAFLNLQKEITELEHKIDIQELAESILIHDIKKPFKSIQGICDIVENEEIDKEELLMWMKTIREICDKGLEQTDTLHGLVEMEKGRFVPTLRRINACKFLNEIIKEMNSLANTKNLQLDFVCHLDLQQDEQRCSFDGDSLYLRLLFSNLILNAIEASPEDQRINIKLDQSSSQLHFEIHNQGAIPKEIREKFFDKYVTFGKKRGTGLGTYIAKIVTEAHHGRISMKSSEQEGTTIMVDLPAH